MSATVALAGPFAAFLKHKRALGYTYRAEAERLAQVARFAATRGYVEPYLSEALVRDFCLSRPERSVATVVSLLRNVGKFLAADDPRTFVAPPRFLNRRLRAPTIRILSRAEAMLLWEAAARVPDRAPHSPHRGLVHGEAIRTLLQTGVRVGELRKLRDADVDLESGVLRILRGKFEKDRLVPITKDAVARLRAYRTKLWERCSDRQLGDSFFPTTDGRSELSETTLYGTFRQILAAAGIRHGGRGHGPRLHDLRHTFAVMRLLAWYEADVDVNAKLPVLATYLGHINVTTSQVYMHFVPEMGGEITRRLDARFGPMIQDPAPEER